MNKQADVIIVGSGLAALQLAHHLHSTSHVIILTKTKIRQSNSYIAQGGIAAVIDKNDSIHSHIEDTLKAGRYHHYTEEVERLADEGAVAVKELIAGGLDIDRDANGQPSLGLEGAHSASRIIHSGGDATGRYTVEHLLATLPANVDIIEEEMAYECLMSEDRSTCIGIKTKNKDGAISHYWSPHVVLATGGAGAIYPATSNQPTMTGDGIAIAFRAGAEIIDMEFVQFHPTLLFTNGAARGLISEAVRGAGATLIDEEGLPVMEGVHPLKDLAPRHITAYEIYKTRTKEKDVFLNIRGIQQFEKQFPTITAMCERNGVPISEGILPVAPGSHFLMGGIAVNSNGCTTVPGLYAVGEAAYSGVHGANRLASNSLLEGIVYGKRLAAFINRYLPADHRPTNNFHYEKQLNNKSAAGLSKTDLQARTMRAAGIIRTPANLESHINYLKDQGIQQWIENGLDKLDRDNIEKIYMYINSYLISRAAFLRQESRGAHIRTDVTAEEPGWQGKRIVQTKNQIQIRGGQHERNSIRIHA